MNTAELQAATLQAKLYEHCKQHGLPILSLVGLVSDHCVARAYTDMEGVTAETFRRAVASILYKDRN